MDFNVLYNPPIRDFVNRVSGEDPTRARKRIDRQAEIFGHPRFSSQEDTEPLLQEDHLGGAIQSSKRMVDSLLPDIEELTPQERERLSELTAKSGRYNQPTQHRSVGTAANPNNPFSLDTRGMSGAFGRSIAERKDQNNQMKLEEMAPELNELSQRQRMAAENAQSRSEFMQKNVPDEYRDRVDRGRELDDRAHTEGREDNIREDEQTHDMNKITETQRLVKDRQESLQKMRNEGARDIVELRATLDNNSNSNKPPSTGIITSSTDPIRKLNTQFTNIIGPLEQDLAYEVSTNGAESDAAIMMNKMLEDARHGASITRTLTYYLSDPENFNSPQVKKALKEFEEIMVDPERSLKKFDINGFINSLPNNAPGGRTNVGNLWDDDEVNNSGMI